MCARTRSISGLVFLLAACQANGGITEPEPITPPPGEPLEPTPGNGTMVVYGRDPGGGSRACAAVPGGLVSWWRGEAGEEFADATGTNPATAIGPVAAVPGRVGQGLAFDGRSSLLVPHHSSLEFDHELTVELWFSWTDTGGWWGLFGKRDGVMGVANYGANASRDYPGGLGIYYNDPDPKVSGGDDPPQYGFEASRLGSVPDADTFHHFAGTYRQHGNRVEVQIFLDGVLAKADTLPGRFARGRNDAPLMLGASYPGRTPGEAFLGVLDEVSIYDRVLDASEIAAIAQAAEHGKCTSGPAPADTITFDANSSPITVNCRNPDGLLVVHVLNGNGFDPGLVDVNTVRLAGARETHTDARTGLPRRHDEDVDADGDLDLVLHFRVGDTTLQCGDTDITLGGMLTDGTAFTATSPIQTVGG